jgi:hypothetical protein
MSAMPPTGQPGQPGQPSEEELHAALSQMRSAPAVQVVAEVLSALLNAGQVKLGRNDGRLLLDIASMINDHTRGLVEKELTQQVDQAMQQLRVAQVEAEQEVIQAAQQGQAEQGDLPRRPPAPGEPREAPAVDGEDGAEGEEPPVDPGPSAASRLWVPGR